MGIAEDFRSFFGGSSPAPKGIKKIEQFCSQLRWPVEDRDGNSLSIRFNTPIGQRLLSITVSDTGDVGVAGMSSGINCHISQLHQLAAPYLLIRNSAMLFGAWKMNQSGSTFAFEVQEMFMPEGMTLAIFKAMCEALANEVGNSISYMRDKDWL